MPSRQANELKSMYENWVVAMGKNPDMPLDEWRDMIEHWEVVTAEPGGVDYVEVDAGGVRAMWAVPHGCADDRVIFCLHGGGFVTGSIYTHRKLYAHLAKVTGCRALIVGYRRSPENQHPAQVEDTVAAYRWLLDQGFHAGRIAFAGDSSGGGLAVTTMLVARERGLAMPAASMLLSPWVDMEISGESVVSNNDTDVLFERAFLEMLARMFVGEDGDRRDPHVNVLHGELAGLPPLYIQVSGAEMLLDDGRRLAERAEASGVEAKVDVFADLQHTFQFSAGRAPEADDAIDRLAGWARPKLGLAGPA
jgi:epsilon-lactone hydrolase